MKRKPFFSARNIAYLAILTALVIVLGIFAAAIPVASTGVSLNFSLIPIVLGAILLGPAAGAFLGFVCGLIIFFQVISGIPLFYAVIWATSPVVTFFTCVVKTTVAGLAAGFLYRIIAKKSRLGATFAASAAVPIINTALFILGCLCMTDAIFEFQSQISDSQNILVFICVSLVTFNFFIELAINLVFAPAICRIEHVVNSKLSRYRADREGGRAVKPESETQGEEGQHHTPTEES